MAPSSTTTARGAPSRKSESIGLSEPVVRMKRPASPRIRHRSTENSTESLRALRRDRTSVISLPIQTAFRSWDNEG